MDVTTPTEGLETKAGQPAHGEIARAFDAFMESFEAFRAANDERLDEIERRMAADALNEDKVARIGEALDDHKRRLDALALKAARPALSTAADGGGDAGAEAAGHKAAFEAYVRRGATVGLDALERKALSVGSDADGGHLVPDETEAEIGRLLSQASPVRAIAGQARVSTNVYRKPFATAGASAGWVAEATARIETDTPTLAELQFPAMELYAMPAATQSLLDDAAVDIDRWLAEEVQIAFAEQEGAAFVSGDGVNKPRGFLDYDAVAETSWSWGEIGYVASGADGAFAGSDPGDRLIDLVYALKSGYRSNARWVMNRATQAVIRKFKDGDGNYLWQPGIQAGAPATLLGFPITEAEDMPDIAADALAIAFGDFRRGYLVVDRIGVRVLRDPFSSKPFVMFYTTKRVGGGVQNFEAIKLMKFAAA